jgi:hypothetical protein
MAKKRAVVLKPGQSRQVTLRGPLDTVVNAFDLGRMIDNAVEKSIGPRIDRPMGPPTGYGLANCVGQGSPIDAEVPYDRINAPVLQHSGPGLREQFFESRQRCEDRHQSLMDDIARLRERVLELEAVLYGSTGKR